MNPYAKIVLQELKASANWIVQRTTGKDMSEDREKGPYYEDEELECVDCKQPFTFTGGERKFYAEREFTPPKRCKPCRERHKAAKAEKEKNKKGR